MTETLPKEEDKGWDEKLSYSSYSNFMACPRKYFHQKVKKTKIDNDASEDTFALRIGKATHQLLEDTKHDFTKLTLEHAKKVATEYELGEDDLAHMIALFRNYQRVRNQTTLVAHHCEFEIVTPNYRGFVDVILKEKDSDKWWIGDYKTGSSYSKFLNSRLGSDWQLNLYSYHVKEIAASLGLKEEDFQGCKYMLTVKSRLKRNPGESFKSYLKRLDKSITSYEISVPKDELDPVNVYDQFKRAHVKVASLYKMKGKQALNAAPKNLGSCDKFYKPCEYWSQCYGKTYTESLERDVLTSG